MYGKSVLYLLHSPFIFSVLPTALHRLHYECQEHEMNPICPILGVQFFTHPPDFGHNKSKNFSLERPPSIFLVLPTALHRLHFERQEREMNPICPVCFCEQAPKSSLRVNWPICWDICLFAIYSNLFQKALRYTPKYVDSKACLKAKSCSTLEEVCSDSIAECDLISFRLVNSM